MQSFKGTQPAFYLSDALLALLVSLVAMAGVGASQRAIAHSMHETREMRVARQLLDHAKTMSPQQLASLPERTFDVMGRPADTSPHYYWLVQVETRPKSRTYRVSLSWESKGGQSQQLYFTRQELIHE